MRLEDWVWPRLNIDRDLEALPVLPAGSGIPRVVHQTYPRRDLPPPLREAVDRTRELNPGWEHRLYDDAAIEDFIGRHFGPPVLAAYRRIDPRYGAARADLFRYLLLYREGGVYLDIKSLPTRPLDHVLHADDRFLLSHWHGERYAGMGVHAALRGIGPTEYQQWHIVAAPGHPFLKAVAESVLRNLRIYNHGLHGVGQLGVLHVTGPVAYTLAIHPLLARHPHRFVDSAQHLGFEYSIFMAGGHAKSHQSSFRLHYSHQSAPLVGTGRVRRGYGEAIRTMRRLLRKAGVVAD